MRLITSEDGLRAYIQLFRSDVRKRISRDQLRELLAKGGIRHGLCIDDWEDRFGKFVRGLLVNNHVLVAQGTEPIPGEDGRIEFLVNTEKTFPPPEDPQKAEAVIPRIEKGQPILRVIPPGKGVPGKTVTGEEIAPQPGTPAELPPMVEVIQDEEDPNLYVAARNGVLRFSRKGEVIIDELEEYGRSLPASAQFLEFPHSLLIRGDIKRGARVRVKGDLYVWGAVEDAQVQVEGDIYIFQGFVGRGAGKMKAGRNAYMRHIDNQRVAAAQDIYIYEESIQSHLAAGRNIIFTGDRSNLIGGRALVGQQLHVFRAGNEKHTPTEIIMAQSNAIYQQLLKKQRELPELRETLKKIKEYIAVRVKQRVAVGCVTSVHDPKLKELLTARRSCEQRIEELKREIPELKRKWKEERRKLYVEISGVMYPGVIIRHLGRAFQVYHPTVRVRVSYEDI